MQQSLVFLSEQAVMIHPCSSHWYSSQNRLSWSIRAAVTGIPLRTGCHDSISWFSNALVILISSVTIHLCNSHYPSMQQSLVFLSEQGCHDPSACSMSLVFGHASQTRLSLSILMQQSLVFLSEQGVMTHPCSSHWYSSQNRVTWSIRAAVTGVPLRPGCHDPSVQQSLVFLQKGCHAALMIHPCTCHSHINSVTIHLCNSHFIPLRTGCHAAVITTTHHKARVSWSNYALVICMTHLCSSHDLVMHQSLFHLPHRARVSWSTNASVIVC